MLDVNDEQKRNRRNFLAFLLLISVFVGIAGALLAATGGPNPLTWWQGLLVIGLLSFLGSLWLPKDTWPLNGVIILVSAVLGAFLFAFLYPRLPQPILVWLSSKASPVTNDSVHLTWLGVANGFLSCGLVGFWVRVADRKAIRLDPQGVLRYLVVFVLVFGIFWGTAIIQELAYVNRHISAFLFFFLLIGIRAGIQGWDRRHAQDTSPRHLLGS